MQKLMQLWIVVGLCGVLGLLSGCSTIPKDLQRPQVSLAGLSIAELGLLEQRFVVSLRVKNPNDLDLPINGLNVNLDVNGQPFANGVSNEKVTLPRLGETIVKLKVTTSLASVWKQLRAIQLGELKVKYKMSGKVFIPLLPMGVPFERSGELSGLE